MVGFKLWIRDIGWSAVGFCPLNHSYISWDLGTERACAEVPLTTAHTSLTRYSLQILKALWLYEPINVLLRAFAISERNKYIPETYQLLARRRKPQFLFNLPSYFLNSYLSLFNCTLGPVEPANEQRHTEELKQPLEINYAALNMLEATSWMLLSTVFALKWSWYCIFKLL